MLLLPNLQTKTMTNTDIVTYTDDTIIKHSYLSIDDVALGFQPVTSHHVTLRLITIYKFTTGSGRRKVEGVKREKHTSRKLKGNVH